MDQNKKITINEKEYDIRDLSEVANRLIQCIQLADQDITLAQAGLFIKEEGRKAAIQQLITEVEKEPSND